MSPPPDKRRHPEGGRKAKRAYAARPYLNPRDAGFYGLCWASGLAAYAGGSGQGAILAGGVLWAAWLFLAWRISVWLRAQEDFDSAAANAMSSSSAGIILGVILPALAALGAMLVTRGQLWWEPLIAAGLAGMAGNAAAAFLERSFKLGGLWALAALVGGLGHPAPFWPLAWLALLLGAWLLVVTMAQERAFRHWPEGPAPAPGRLASDLLIPAGVLTLALAAAWAWTPALKPRPVQVLPRMNLALWEPGERHALRSVPFFGKPPVSARGEVEVVPTAESEGVERLVGGLVSGGSRAIGGAAALGAAAGLYLWWRKRRKDAAAKALLEAQKRKETLRGTGVSPKRQAPTAPPPEDPREAVVYWYNRLRAELAGAGIPRREALTPAEYARAAVQEHGVSEPSLGGLTELFHRAEYSPHAVAPEDSQRARTWYEGIRAKAAERVPKG